MGNKPDKPCNFDEIRKDNSLNSISLEEILMYNTLLYDSDVLPFTTRYIRGCVVGQKSFLFVFVLGNGDVVATRHIGFAKIYQNPSSILFDMDGNNLNIYVTNEEVNEFIILKLNGKFPKLGNKASLKQTSEQWINDFSIQLSNGIVFDFSSKQIDSSPNATFSCYQIKQHFLFLSPSVFDDVAGFTQPVSRLLILQIQNSN